MGLDRSPSHAPITHACVPVLARARAHVWVPASELDPPLDYPTVTYLPTKGSDGSFKYFCVPYAGF